MTDRLVHNVARVGLAGELENVSLSEKSKGKQVFISSAVEETPTRTVQFSPTKTYYNDLPRSEPSLEAMSAAEYSSNISNSSK